MTISVAFFSHIEGLSPIKHLRIIGPLNAAGIKVNLGISEKQVQLSTIAQSDIVLIQRDFSKDLDTYRNIVKEAKIQNKPVVLDMDDLLLNLPVNHPDRKSSYFAQSLVPMLQSLIEVDYITVTTSKLRENLLQYNKNIFILPNLLDDKLWTFKPPIKKNIGNPIIIGYMGTDSHAPDIEFIAPVLSKLAKIYNDKIQFRFYGAKPSEDLIRLPQMNWSPIKTYQYVEFVSDFQKLDIDIFIAPLVNSLFNTCKSPIKYFELSAQGSAGVYWGNPPYEEVITDGVDGLLASSLDEWYLQLTRLIEDYDLRFQIAQRAQETIRSNWLLSQNSYRWLETYDEIINKGLTINRSATIDLDVVQSISDQLDQYHKKYNRPVSELMAKVEKLEKKEAELNKQLFEKEKTILEQRNNLSELEKSTVELRSNLSELEKSVSINRKILAEKDNEILSYSLSRSWQLTRPLRKIKKILKGKS